MVKMKPQQWWVVHGNSLAGHAAYLGVYNANANNEYGQHHLWAAAKPLDENKGLNNHWVRIETNLDIEQVPRMITMEKTNGYFHLDYNPDENGFYVRLSRNDRSTTRAYMSIHNSSFAASLVEPTLIEFLNRPPGVKLYYYQHSETGEPNTREKLVQQFEITHLSEEIPLLISDQANMNNLGFWKKYLDEEFDGPHRKTTQLVTEIRKNIRW